MYWNTNWYNLIKINVIWKTYKIYSSVVGIDMCMTLELYRCKLLWLNVVYFVNFTFHLFLKYYNQTFFF